MAWTLSQSLGIEAYDAGNNRTLYRTRVYLGATQYHAYSGGNAANGSVNVDGQTASWTGPTAVSLNGGQSVEIFTTTFWISGNANGYKGTVSASAGFNGGGGFAPGQLYASTSAGGFDYDRKPSAPLSCTAVLNANKTITVTAGNVSSPAGTATFYVQSAHSTDGGLTWTAFGNQQTMTNQAYTWTTLQPGLTYKFRTWATNTDGTGPSIESNSVLLPSGFKIKTANGLVNAKTVKIKTADGTWKDVRTFKIKTANGWVNTA